MPESPPRPANPNPASVGRRFRAHFAQAPASPWATGPTGGGPGGGPGASTPAAGAWPFDDPLRWWRYQAGADWRHPDGPGSDIQGRERHPVVHVAHADAVAYAKWARKRLPTEAEFEFAARGGLSGKLYAWGDLFRPAGRAMANTFQGRFPVQVTAQDGFPGIAPADQFPANGYGLPERAG